MVRARVFVGNIVSDCKTEELSEAFSAFGTINRCDLKGTYAFIEYADEEDANVAIKEMDKTVFKGRELNVELGGKARRADRSEKINGNESGTVKLHISGIKMGGDSEELASLFEPFGKVVDKYIMTNKDVGFVHIDANVVEKAIAAMQGEPFNGGHMKIEYGQVGQRKPRYDRMAPKVTLHVGGISEEAEEKMIALKFGIFGSVGEVKFLRNKNIAFVEIQEEFAEVAIKHLHGSLFYGKEIKVAYSKHNKQREPQGRDRDRRDERPRDSGYSRDSRDYQGRSSRHEEPHRAPPPPPSYGNDKDRFVFDDFLQLSNSHPPVSKVTDREIDGLVQRRRRLETIHPYERRLLSSYTDFPQPPPEFIRLIRDRAELKAQILLHQAECEGRLGMLSRDEDNYGFNAAPARSRSPVVVDRGSSYSTGGTDGYRDTYPSRDSYDRSRPSYY